MFFNENELHQLVKLRQEEIERKARDAWKLADVERESFVQKLSKKWNRKSVTIQPNGDCACQCG
jgi:hypothetical protein